MRTLSKYALSALALIVTLLLIACGGAATDGATTGGATTADMAPAAEEAAPTLVADVAAELQAEQAAVDGAEATQLELAMPAADANSVSGTVTYVEQIALDPASVITVRIEDVTLADAPSTVVAEQRIAAEGRQVPIPFDLPYDPAGIDPARIFSVSATIEDGGGKLLFVSDTRVPVLTGGSPTEGLEVMVVPATSVGTSAVNGFVSYDPALPIPADAVLTVQIQDITLQDVAATIIAEQVIPIQGQVPPLAYSVSYDPAVLMPGNLYTMAARVSDAAGNLLLISDTVTPVLTNGAPTDNVEIRLVPIQ